MQNFDLLTMPRGNNTAHYAHLQEDELLLEDNLVLNRLCNWTKDKDKIYKFQSPCKHKLYRKGDSLCEETGLSRPTVRKQLDQICTRYYSKETYRTATDKFKGMPFCSYFDRLRKITWYIKSPDYSKNFFLRFSLGFTSVLPRHTLNTEQDTKHPPLPPLERQEKRKLEVGSLEKNEGKKITTASATPHIANQDHDKTVPTHHTSKRQRRLIREQKKARNPKKRETNPNFITTSASTIPPVSKQDREKAEKMRQAYLRATKGKIHTPPFLSEKMTRILLETLKAQFHDSLEDWEAYTESVGSSKLLTENTSYSSFQAWLPWVIKPENIKKVRAGKLGVTPKDEPTATRLWHMEKGREMQEKINSLNLSSDLKQKLAGFAQYRGWSLYNAWFDRCVFRELPDATVEITAPLGFIKEYIENNFLYSLERWLGREISLTVDKNALWK